MSKHRRTRICREGWRYLVLTAVVFVVAVVMGVNLTLILGGMLVGPVLFNWRLVVVTLRGLRVRRKLPRGVCAGDLLVVQVEAANTRRRPASWAVIVEDEIRPEGQTGRLAAGRPIVYFPYIRSGETRAEAYRGRLPQRGRYRFGPLKVSTRFPFGLLRRTITLAQEDELIVFPRLGRLAPDWITRHHEAFEGSQCRQARQSRVSGEFYGVREWRAGDSRRWVHWRASARHGSLVVRQFERPLNRDVAVLVDLWQPAKPGQADLENVELAVSFAATVVADVCRKGDSSLLLGTSAPAPACLDGPASLPLMEEAMEQLAVARADHEDRLPELLERALGQVEPGADVILVSPRKIDLDEGPGLASLWSDPARRMAARRIRLINTAADGGLAEYFQPE